MGLCSVRMPLLECVANDGAVRCAGSAFGQKCYSPEPHDPIHGVVAVGDQQKRAWPEFTRLLPRDRLETTRFKPWKVEASGGRLGDETHRQRDHRESSGDRSSEHRLLVAAHFLASRWGSRA